MARIAVGANALLGAPTTLEMSYTTYSRWTDARVESIREILSAAAGANVEELVIAGALFGDGYVTQSLLERTIQAIGCSELPVRYLPLHDELPDLESRVELPANLSVERWWSDEGARTLEFAGGERLALVHDGSDFAAGVPGSAAPAHAIGNMAALRFGETLPVGCPVLDVRDGDVSAAGLLAGNAPAFATVRVKLDETMSVNDVAAIAGSALKDLPRNDAVRVELAGSVSPSSFVDSAKLVEALQSRFFYVEVHDECRLAIDTEALESEVSLFAEFVRMVMGDIGLSETEKTRIIRCGWFALNGKEIPE